MAVTRKHSLFAVEFHATLVGGVTAQRVYLGDAVRSDPRSGEVYARNIAIVGRRPGATFTTEAIAAALAQLTVSGKDVSALTTGLKFYAQKHQDAGTRASGSVNRKFTGVKGIVCPRNISCEYMGDAKLDAEYLATYDGTNDPIVEADTTALPSGVVDSERFTLGKVTVGGIVLDHLKGISIDFGIQVEIEAADNDIYPRFCSIRAIQPRVTLRGIDLEWLKAANIPRAGIVCTQANTIFYLQKRTQDTASLVAAGTAQHVKFAMAGIANIADAMSANDQSGSETSLVIVGNYDGTNAPLTVTTASAIT